MGCAIRSARIAARQAQEISRFEKASAEEQFLYRPKQNQTKRAEILEQTGAKFEFKRQRHWYCEHG